MNVFWQTIAGYNAATWLLQALLVVAGIVLTALLYRRPSPRVKVAMKVYLALLNGWIAVAYYLWACAERPYSGVMALFWGVMAAVWIYDIAVNYTTFERTRKHDRIAFVFYLMPFVYPLFSLLRGLEFPMVTSPVMPCSVAVFTIGLLLAFSKRVNLFVILFLCHWALVGFSKIYFFGIPEDFVPLFQGVYRPQFPPRHQARPPGDEFPAGGHVHRPRGLLLRDHLAAVYRLEG